MAGGLSLAEVQRLLQDEGEEASDANANANANGKKTGEKDRKPEPEISWQESVNRMIFSETVWLLLRLSIVFQVALICRFTFHRREVLMPLLTTWWELIASNPILMACVGGAILALPPLFVRI